VCTHASHVLIKYIINLPVYHYFNNELNANSNLYCHCIKIIMPIIKVCLLVSKMEDLNYWCVLKQGMSLKTIFITSKLTFGKIKTFIFIFLDQ